MSKRERSEWGERVAAELLPYANQEIVVLAGVAYLAWLRPDFRNVQLPLQGLGLGERLAWLNRENSAEPDCARTRLYCDDASNGLAGAPGILAG